MQHRNIRKFRSVRILAAFALVSTGCVAFPGVLARTSLAGADAATGFVARHHAACVRGQVRGQRRWRCRNGSWLFGFWEAERGRK